SEDAPASKEAKYSKPKKPVLTDIPQGLLKDLVAKVGPGGVTREDYQLYQRRLANESGVSSSAFTDAERKKALDKAIEDETLFQAALAAGLLEDNYIRWSIREEYRADLTTGQISPGLYGDEELMKYYKAHPDEFTEPPSIHVVGLQFGSNVPISVVRRKLEEAQDDPDAVKDWKPIGGWDWIKQGDDLHFIHKEVVDELFEYEAGEVSDIVKDDYGNSFILRVTERKEGGLLSFEEARGKIKFAMINAEDKERKGKLNAELKAGDKEADADEILYRRALEAGLARRYNHKQRIINTWLDNEKLKREEALPELRKKYPADILIMGEIGGAKK
ncbi:peptidyl-prolyl cis-trans isomerase, partial [Candidatus Sumerlaeota bacterium]|nr:peptidyl-prolyl cis-trans isomerase [Candidatus Sumerlaeota bacterium]